MRKYLLFVFLACGMTWISSCTKQNPNPPVADFTFTGAGVVPCQVVFDNKSTAADKYSWNFGDGTNSTETNPVKTYTTGGTFTVTLTATGKGGVASVSKQLVIQFPRPVVTISALPVNIFLPNNCERSFIITNTGPPGSILEYAVYDDGALGGFLDYTNGTGALTRGSSVTVSVMVDPRFVSGQPSLIGSNLSLHVSTPRASNATDSYVSVHIRGIAEQAQNILGTWSGTWSGKSYGASNPGQPSPDTTVSGTWTLNVQSLDPVSSIITGVLYWNGTDAYWTYTFDANGNITSATAQPFTVNQTIQLTSSNSSLYFPLAGSACDRFRLLINDSQGSSYGVYGPRLLLDMNLQAKLITGGSSTFVAWPYAPIYINNLSSNQSNGAVSGVKL
ncbi:MAG: PKD domain-containing protein [Chitinophagaceae bacterium]